ncbi:MAG: ATP-binding cassette domain-containing protein [Rhodobacterales bacterium]|nr:ATP-binding cassette domain-containing protein [Rhodobacterales bacterium]
MTDAFSHVVPRMDDAARRLSMGSDLGGQAWGALSSLRSKTDLSACLLPLLEALNWRGHPRHVAESLPHFVDTLDITAFRNVMAQLNFSSRPVPLRVREIDPRLMPCLFLPHGGDAQVMLNYNGGTLNVFDGGTSTYTTFDERANPKGVAYFFSVTEPEEDQGAQRKKAGWFSTVSDRFRPLLYQILVITLVLNVLALSTPLFVMAVYDRVIATGSLETLSYFAVGVGIAVTCDLVLRSIRARILAFIGARLDNLIGNAVFQKILYLPPAFTERATVGAQVARLKDFETVREFFTGPMALVFFELPFVLLFVVVIALLGGPVAFVPLIMIALFALTGVIMSPFVRNAVSRSARTSSKRQELVVETLSHMRAVRYCGAERTWMGRYRDLSASAALANFKTAQMSALVNNISHVLMVGSGVSTIAFGVFRVFDGDMTIGALVACMILVWRVLAPLQTGFLTLTKLTQVRSSINQINNLMNIAAERDPSRMVTPLKKMSGWVTFNRVSLRYSAEADPALVGVSFEARPGEIIAVVGANGSGKSTVMKLVGGMYQPQAGSVRIDNMDIRQMDPIELRYAVGYVPQNCEFFYGTIAQNLRLAQPLATDADLRWAAELAGLLDDILAMPDGFETRIGDTRSQFLPTSFQQRLNLARGYLKRAPVMLFDEPGNGLDFEGDQAFMRALEQMRGNTTVFIVTHRPSHLRLVDKIVWLDAGQVRAFGPAEEVKKRMPKEFL